MKVWYSEITFSTRRKSEVVDLTDQILQEVRKSGIKNGLLVVNLPHATASLTLNEGESGLKHDLLKKLDELIPPVGNYEHDRIDDNAHAHLKSALLGTCRVLPVVEGRVVRGTWQNFLVIEEDGPRTRRLSVFLMGE
ncbi:MAG: YjbQ family protein [Hadesarchaea archaeon]|nr:MAG: YjbQ family protein [Hadesarchaea archaeon]TDA33694.1 MAG: YjbQ family protein [Hadesarchaea archaeon]